LNKFISFACKGCFIGGVLFLLLNLEAVAATLRVPSQYAAIQQAINAAQNGDTVLVAPGTYVENINFIGKAITVTSEGGASVTTIDGNQVTTVVKFHTGEGALSQPNGFTIQNGTPNNFVNESGGGISTALASPTIKNHIIVNNWAPLNGGGIYVFGGAPLISHNTTMNNQAGLRGAGIAVNAGFPKEFVLVIRYPRNSSHQS
jgi:serine protease